VVRLVDAPAMGRPVRIIWRKRRWVCPDPGCPVGSFVEQDERIAMPRTVLTARACRWAVQQIRREHASVNGLRRQLGTGWRTVWESIKPLLVKADQDASRFEGVRILGVDEHVWHHVSTKAIEDGGRGPKELTGMVDLTRDAHGRTRARLLDLVPGRSGQAYKTWLSERGESFRARVEIATLDPFHGYKNAIDDQLDDARAVLDAFHVVKLATGVVDEVRRRVQQDLHGHRGHRDDPLYRIRNILRAGQENLTDRQRARLEHAFAAHERHVEVQVAWSCAQQVRSAYHQDTHASGRAIAEKVLDSFTSCPIPEVARLGGAPSNSGAQSSWATSTPAAPTTAAPRPSTASSSSTAASPAASATARTTDCACSSSAAVSTPHPTLSGEEPNWLSCSSEWAKQ
jgi:transposase